MVSRIRKQLNPATAIAFTALVFALTGGAFAATSHNGTPTLATAAKSKAKPKAKAGPRGPAGKNGANGAPGATGPAGPAGAMGPGGPAGAKGETGPEGKQGIQGVEGKKGTNGAPGEPGSPWVVGGLPKGATETGTWATAQTPVKFNGAETAIASISFNVPLAAALTETQVHVIAAGATSDPTGCKGIVAKPEAESENLCIFEHEPSLNVANITAFSPETSELGAGRTGTTLLIHATTAGERVAVIGTWAVTG